MMAENSDNSFETQKADQKDEKCESDDLCEVKMRPNNIAISALNEDDLVDTGDIVQKNTNENEKVGCETDVSGDYSGDMSDIDKWRELDENLEKSSYRCDICSKSFSSQNYLDRHNKTKTHIRKANKVVYKCEKCFVNGKNMTFKTQFTYRRHLKSAKHNGINPSEERRKKIEASNAEIQDLRKQLKMMKESMEDLKSASKITEDDLYTISESVSNNIFGKLSKALPSEDSHSKRYNSNVDDIPMAPKRRKDILANLRL